MLKTQDTLIKTERIASAAYLITSFFDDKEPLKWDIRNLSSKLVSKSAHMKDVSADARELLALFSVAKTAGLVSDQNHTILAGEISKLIATAEEMPSKMLPQSFFEVRQTQVESTPEQVSFIKDKSLDTTQPAPAVPMGRPQISAPAQPKRELIDFKEPKEKTLKEFGAVAVKKNARQSIIINLMKKKKEIMIKDVSPLIEGVSEKTIQRELLAMVEQGIVKKEGEKRWSKYSLA